MRLLRLEKKALVTVVLSMGLVTTIGFSSASNVSDSIKTAMPDGNSPLAYTDNPRAENSGATGSEGVLVSSANTSNSDLAAVVKPAKYASTANKQSNSKDIPKDIPKSWLNQVQKDIAQREYHITWQDKTDLPKNKPAWQAPNRAHDFRTYFTEQGLTVVPRSGTKDWLWSLKLIAYGDELTNSEIKPEIKDNRIEYSHSVKLKEWYINNEQGLEQGFTLNAPANSNEANKSQATKNNNTLKLSFQLGGSLTATLTNNNQTISLKDKNKQQRFTFGKLKVIDANNKTLKSYFELDKQSQILTLVTNDSNAVYPITVDPVLSGASPFLEINLTDAVFGWSVASAGDVNGDGYGDVIIGAPYFSSGPIDEGAAFVYLGSPNGLNPTAAWTAKGNKASAFFGWSVASAGNVNGDVNAGNGLPIDDVIIGAVAYDNGVNISEGAVFVYLGSSTGLSSVADWNAVGNQRFVAFGNSVASAGDVDGDGYDDVIIGAPTYDKGQFDEGAAFVYLGSSTGLTKTFGSFGEPSKAPDWFAESNQDFSQFGISVASAGDVNGDGYSDVIIGASSYSNGQTNEGAVFVYLGSITGLTTTSGAAPELNPVADWSVESNQANSNFGISVASAGNINGDANSVTGIPIDAVIIGASLYDNDQSNEGAAFVYLGTTSGLSTSAAWTAESNQIGAQFGYSVASAGDVNGDGFGDVIIGANGYDSGESNEGAASVYLGNTNGLNPGAAWTAGSNQAGASFGISVASAGDVNGDGFGDVIVGARYYDNGEAFEGAASVFLGSSSGLSSVSIWGSESDKTYAYFGWSVASAGDVNGDGFGDVIVGAYGYDNGESNEGAAYVYLGTTNGLSSGAAWTVESNQIGALFGWSVASAGDVNGDGYGDVIVGANGYDSGESNEGVAFVYMGSSTGLTTAVNTGMGPSLVADWTAESNQADARFGISVASAGDVNGDGFGDVIVGADSYYTNGQFNEGAAFVYLGTFNGLSPVATWSAEGDQAYASFGISVASAGDVNGDGFGDVIVGANLYDNGESNEGAAFVYLGAANGLSPSAAWTAESNQADARFGISVASAGDVNGDGFGDVIVGARYYDNGESNEGAAFMYLGTMNGLSPSAAWTAESNQISAYFGRSVASAGDVNGDGFGDVIVGVYRYDNAEDDEGAAFMYLGTMNGLSPSAAWTVESNQISAYFGWSVASAGDVNGDGFGDVVVGSPYYYNGEINEGVVGVYDLTPPLAPFTPSGSYNITQHLVGSRSDLSTLIPTCGLSDRRDSFKLEVKINNAAVNAPLQLEWEVKANGEKFDDMTTTVVTVNNADGLGSATISETITGLQADTAYRWRARVLENGVAGPWLRILNHDVQGCDIRTRAEADIALTVNAPNNVGVNHEFDAVFSIANTVGPDRAPSVVFNTWYYPKTLPILGVVADSGGSCEIQNLLDQNQSIILSRVGCNFPNIPFGTTAKVTLRLKGTQEPASHQLGATVSHVGYEPDTTNNTVSSMVNILPTLALKVVPSPSLTSLTTFENDQIDNFTVQLTSPPDGNVYVTLNSIPAEEAQVFPTQMQFDSTNWDTPLPVTVRGVRDAVSDGNASFAITLVAKADPDKATDTEQLAAAGDVTVNGDNNDVLAMTITDTGLSIPHARAPGYGATITGTSATLTWDKVVHPQEDPVSFNIYLCTDSALAPTSCQTINPVVQASLMPLWITAGAGGSGILFIGFMATRPRKRWLVVAGMIAIGTTLVSCGGSSGSSLPPSAPPAADTMGTTVTGLSAGTYYWRVEAYDPGNGGIPRVSSEVMIFTVQ